MAQDVRLPEKRIRQLSLLERMDVRSIEIMRPLLQKQVSRGLGQLGQLGNEPPLLFLSAGLFIGGLFTGNARLRRAASRMGLAHAIAIGFKQWGKNHIDRSRPEEQLRHGRYHMAMGHSQAPDLRSFPSGHTAGSFAVARAFSREYPRYATPALAAAAVIGVLQVPRLAHYPGDVIAGVFAGTFAEQLTALILNRL